MNIDWSKADAVVAAYVEALKDNHPLRLGRSWLEVTMHKTGFAPDFRGWQFGESHAAWYACLIKSRQITKVTKLESSLQSNPSTTAKTIQKLTKGSLRHTPTGQYLKKFTEAAKI